MSAMRRSDRRGLRRLRDVRGFTVVEMMVAVMILSIGVLGLASTAAVVTRQMGGGSMQAMAASRASSRIEQLYAMNCTKLDGEYGSATSRGITEEWKAAKTTRAVEVVMNVTYQTTRGPRSQTYENTIPCPALP